MDKLFGIDISEFQSKMNLDKAKLEGVKFAILRAGYTGMVKLKGKQKIVLLKITIQNVNKLIFL